jgi:hypothetical protein
MLDHVTGRAVARTYLKMELLQPKIIHVPAGRRATGYMAMPRFTIRVVPLIGAVIELTGILGLKEALVLQTMPVIT